MERVIVEVNEELDPLAAELGFEPALQRRAPDGHRTNAILVAGMAPLFRAHSPSTRIVVDSVDAQFLRDARRAFRVGPSGGPAALLGADYGDEIVGELNVYAAADCVLTVSQAEAELIGSLANDPTLTHSVPDSERPEAATVGFEARSGMLFVGSFQHPPNADAVRYACEEILPLIPEELRRQHPLYVVGDALGENVRAYADGLDHVRLVGWVPALTPYYEQARVVLVPLRYGAGTKRKVIQALLAKVPMHRDIKGNVQACQKRCDCREQDRLISLNVHLHQRTVVDLVDFEDVWQSPTRHLDAFR